MLKLQKIKLINICSCRWSWKNADDKQLLKYTKENVDYYIVFGINILHVPFEHLKFLDETHVTPKSGWLLPSFISPHVSTLIFHALIEVQLCIGAR